jgi:hypothetical protein
VAARLCAYEWHMQCRYQDPVLKEEQLSDAPADHILIVTA